MTYHTLAATLTSLLVGVRGGRRRLPEGPEADAERHHRPNAHGGESGTGLELEAQRDLGGVHGQQEGGGEVAGRVAPEEQAQRDWAVLRPHVRPVPEAEAEARLLVRQDEAGDAELHRQAQVGLRDELQAGHDVAADVPASRHVARVDADIQQLGALEEELPVAGTLCHRSISGAFFNRLNLIPQTM